MTDFTNKFIKQHPIQKLEVDNAIGEYIVGGKGRIGFLIFPGGGQDTYSCYDLIDAFEDKYKVIVVNFTGFSHLSSFFKFVNQILQKEKIDKVIVYGLSLGGVFAQHYAIQNPEKVSKIILSHTTSTKSKLLRRKLIIPGKILYFFLPIIPISLFKYAIKNLAPRIQAKTSEIENLYLKYSTAENLQRRKEMGQSMQLNFPTKEYLTSFYKLGTEMRNEENNWNLKDLNRLSEKMLIIKTDNDPLAQDEGIFKKYYPEANVYTFHETGHYTPFVQFENMVEVIKKFLNHEK